MVEHKCSSYGSIVTCHFCYYFQTPGRVASVLKDSKWQQEYVVYNIYQSQPLFLIECLSCQTWRCNELVFWVSFISWYTQRQRMFVVCSKRLSCLVSSVFYAVHVYKDFGKTLYASKHKKSRLFKELKFTKPQSNVRISHILFLTYTRCKFWCLLTKGIAQFVYSHT